MSVVESIIAQVLQLSQPDNNEMISPWSSFYFCTDSMILKKMLVNDLTEINGLSLQFMVYPTEQIQTST